MQINVNFYNLRGDAKGKKLFIVADDESSSVWLADDAAHLEQLVREDYLGEADVDDPIVESFDFDWGYTILFSEIGEVDR
jgi:hypothetical protein